MYKVMIVDDEPLIRTGLANLIDWDALNCEIVQESEDGASALAYLCDNSVDILITDIKMPGMNGLELAKVLREKNIDVKVIFLTAFSDFNYAQEAIRYHVVEYVVKTNYIEKMPPVVERAIAAIEKERLHSKKSATLQFMMEQNVQELQEKLLKDILHGTITDDATIRQKAKDCTVELDRFSVVLFHIVDDSLSQRDARFFDHAMTMLREFIMASYQQYVRYTIALEQDRIAVVLALSDNATEYLLQQTNAVLTTIKEGMSVIARAGVSKQHTGLALLCVAYQECCTALERTEMFAPSSVTLFEESYLPKPFSKQLRQALECLFKSLNKFSLEDALSLFQDVFHQCEKESRSVQSVKRICADICCICHMLLLKQNSDAIQWQIMLPTVREILSCDSPNRMFELMQRLFRTMDSEFLQTPKYSLLVKEALATIYERHNEELNLTSIAARLHVNKNYLGNLFKKETGESIVDAIAKCRIEQAVLLLQDPANRVFEISARVGFSDPAYFTNVFTKLMGMSPTAYRNTLQ